MDYFIKLCVGIMIVLILSMILSRYGKEFSVLLITAACCLTVIGATSFLIPVIDFFRTVSDLGQLDRSIVSIVLKATGIGLLSEIIHTICSDAGNAALGKILQIVAGFAILWLSIPLFTTLLELVEEILVML